MRKSLISLVGTASLLLTGCVTAGGGGAPLHGLSPLVDALTRPVESLATEAEAGDRRAQYAVSVLAAEGLRGVPKDLDRAERLRRASTSPTSTMAITQYTAGLNGAPGRTNIINVPQYDPNTPRLAVLDPCVAALKTGKLSTPKAAYCGRPEIYDWLRQRWAGVDAPVPVAWRVAALTCEDGMTVAGFWGLAGEAFGDGEYATAARYADRIIQVCGETEPSWHPRVMRALIATADGEHERALALLAPVPQPAPPPIGSYSSFVVLRALAGAKNRTGFVRARDVLVQASVRAVTDPAGPVKGRAVERFTAGAFQVAALEADIPGPRLSSSYSFLVSPDAQDGAPFAIHLTRSPALSGGSAPDWFIDEYRCDGRSTLKYFEPRPERPSYAEVKAVVVERLAGGLQPTSGSSFDLGLSACQFPTWVAPGLPG